VPIIVYILSLVTNHRFYFTSKMWGDRQHNKNCIYSAYHISFSQSVSFTWCSNANYISDENMVCLYVVCTQAIVIVSERETAIFYGKRK